jgi:hypothetical protein
MEEDEYLPPRTLREVEEGELPAWTLREARTGDLLPVRTWREEAVREGY